MENTVNIERAGQMPPTVPVAGNVEKGSGATIDSSKLNQEWDQKKGSAPVGLGTTPESRGFVNAANDHLDQALTNVRGVEGKVGSNINTSNFQRALATLNKYAPELSDQQCEQIVADLAKKLEVPDGFQPTPINAYQEVESAQQHIGAAQDLVAASGASYPEHTGYHKQVADAQATFNPTNALISGAVSLATEAQNQAARYAEQMQKRLDSINMLNELDRLLSKYQHLEGAVDLAKPGEGQEKDFARIETLRKHLVENDKIPLSWSEGKWESANDLKGIIGGVDGCRQSLFSENQTQQIFLQKVTTAEQQFLLLATTIISKQAELIREIIRSMQR